MRTAVNFPLLLEKGLDGLRHKVDERRSRINLTCTDDLHGDRFLKAIDIVLDAVSLHIERFASWRKMAATETRESRRDELLAMAENCDVIAHEPPKPSGRHCNCAISSSLSCKSNRTVTRCRLAAWTSISTRSIVATWS